MGFREPFYVGCQLQLDIGRMTYKAAWLLRVTKFSVATGHWG